MSLRMMTMSDKDQHWSIAAAKAGLAGLVRNAQEKPQVIERRGVPVAVVVALGQFEELSAAVRWRKFLAASANLRASGGAKLAASPRKRRPSPFGRA